MVNVRRHVFTTLAAISLLISLLTMSAIVVPFPLLHPTPGAPFLQIDTGRVRLAVTRRLTIVSVRRPVAAPVSPFTRRESEFLETWSGSYRAGKGFAHEMGVGVSHTITFALTVALPAIWVGRWAQRRKQIAGFPVKIGSESGSGPARQ